MPFEVNIKGGFINMAYVRLETTGIPYITKVVSGTPSHDFGSGWSGNKNPILTEYDIDNGITEPHKKYTTTLLKPRELIKLKKDGKVYRVTDSAGTFMELYDEENWRYFRRPYTKKNGELTFELVESNEKSEPTTLDGVELSEDDAYNYECFRKLINRYEPGCENGIAKNFLKWYENKKGLINLFRKHPCWNEREKAIIIDNAFFDKKFEPNDSINALDDLRNDLFENFRHYTINEADVIKRFFGYLFEMIRYGLTTENINNNTFIAFNPMSHRYEKETLMGLCARYKKLNDYDLIFEHRKVSKVLNELFKALDTDKADNYNRLFAKLSDTFSIKKSTAKIVLSLNICDYITMSHGNSWTSCHSFENHGGWHAGSVSYALDDTTIVSYGLPADTENKDLFAQRKLFRQLFMLSNDRESFIQSRMYPAGGVYNSNIVHDYFVSAINECLDKTNAYEINDSIVPMSNRNSLQYADYNEKSKRTMYGKTQSIVIGESVFDFKDPHQTLIRTGSLMNNTINYKVELYQSPNNEIVNAA